MSKIDIEQLVKILNLAASDNDHEALVALRMAQKHMKKYSVTWEFLIQIPKPKPKPSRWNPAPQDFNSIFFCKMMECKEFTSSLDSVQTEWANDLIRFYNKHKFLPDEHWEKWRQIWDWFRERS